MHIAYQISSVPFHESLALQGDNRRSASETHLFLSICVDLRTRIKLMTAERCPFIDYTPDLRWISAVAEKLLPTSDDHKLITRSILEILVVGACRSGLL